MATFGNVRRYLTYHLTDNVAELTPFVCWALGGGFSTCPGGAADSLPGPGDDQLPALVLGIEPASGRVLQRPPEKRHLLDAALLRRVFGVLGPAQATVEMLLSLRHWYFPAGGGVK